MKKTGRLPQESVSQGRDTGQWYYMLRRSLRCYFSPICNYLGKRTLSQTSLPNFSLTINTYHNALPGEKNLHVFIEKVIKHKLVN